MIVIIGAGLTGLSIACHLKKGTYKIFEQEAGIGGLCRSHLIDGFTFDYTGHLLHLKDPATERFLKKLLPARLAKIERHAGVYCQGRYLPYPFQANLYGLPPEVVCECITGFIEASMKPRPAFRNANFRQWVQGTFGEGIARHFFIPYNEKLWCRDLRKLTSEWAGWSVPRPTLQEVVRGALGIRNIGMGYNASFYYPLQGGIQILPEALGKRTTQAELGKKIVSINLARKTITLQNGQTQSYDRLVSTMPLPALLRLIEDVPPAFKKAAGKLAYVSVHNINIGINRPQVSDYHWIYFPQPDMPFYRVGFYSNFSPHMAPRNTSSLYIEIASNPFAAKKTGTLLAESINGLQQCGILRKKDRVVAQHAATIKYAYVVFDKFRNSLLPSVFAYLKKRGVISAGRYGSWTYDSMEDSLIQGKKIAGILSRCRES